MSFSRSFAFVAAVASAATSFAEPTAVGSWSGKLILNATSALPAARRQGFEAYKAKITKIKLILIVKKNGTFSTSLEGAPKKAPPQNGKWKQSGKSVMLSVINQPGSQTYNLSPDGRTMKMILPARQGITGELIFTR
jgi:hypothetical protein